jgi:hypothetical protein
VHQTPSQPIADPDGVKLYWRLRSGGSWFWRKKFCKTPILMKKYLDMVALTCHPMNGGMLKTEDHGAGQHGQKARPYLQGN